MNRPLIPNVLTIAGSDSGGGAGIQADLKTFSALGTFGMSVVCAVTAQNTREVTAVHMIPNDVVTAQIEAVFGDIAVAAVKIGMLGDAAMVETVAAALEAIATRGALPPIVLDPVMVAKSGDVLLAADAVVALTERLLPLATVVTPNLPEATKLLGDAEDARTLDEMKTVARRILDVGAKSVVVKGGHLRLDAPAGPGEVVDVLATNVGAVQTFSQKRVDTVNTHGTGCTLSSAIAAHLGRGLSLHDAVEAANTYLHCAISGADALAVGSGHGPVLHFHKYWNDMLDMSVSGSSKK